MSKLLMNLRHVPDDEADEVRALLETHAIAFYETRPSRWGISSGGIWIAEDAQADRAKTLFAEYQSQRQRNARADQAAAEREGRAETFGSIVRVQPLRVLLTFLAVLFLLGLVALPAILIARG